MRFFLIIFLINFSVLYSHTIHAKEYDFSFDLRSSKLTKKTETYNPSPRPSSKSWRLGMKASLLPNFLDGTAELVYGNFGEHSNSSILDWNKYLATLGAKGKWGDLGYGFDFYSVGQQYQGIFSSKYSRKKGRTGYESWLSLNIDKLRIKAKYLKSWTNSTGKTNFIQSFDNWYQIETSYPLSSKPLTELAVTYGLGTRRNYITSSDLPFYQGSLNLFKSNFRFVDEYLSFSAEAKQTSSKNDIGNQIDFQRKSFFFTSKLFPHYNFSITSSYRYTIDSYISTFSENKLNRMESSLGLIYKPKTIPANLRLTSGYRTYQSDNKLTDKEIINFSAQLDWKSKGSYTGLRTDWMVNFRYIDTTDFIHPTSSHSDLGFNLSCQWPLS